MSDDGDSALRGVAAAMIGVGLASLGLLAYLFADAKSRSREAARVFNTKRYPSEEAHDNDYEDPPEATSAAKPAGEGEAPPPPVVPRSSPLNRSQWLDLQGMRDLIRDLSIIDRDFQEMPVNNVAHCDGMVDDKNRYTNILPNPHSRVQLSGSTSEETYINANWVSGFAREREYILTQGPMSNTILDFWRMVWESNARNIVMITKLIEGDRVKCEKYFADRGEKYKIGDFLLAWSTTDVHPHFKLTTMTLGRVDTKESRVIRHFWYDSWPDHGVPETTDSVVSFVHAIDEAKRQAEAEAGGKIPTVVHCSAGVGRTGVFVACDVALQQAEAYRKVDPLGILSHLRKARGGCIQTPAQYLYFILVARDYLVRLGQYEKEK